MDISAQNKLNLEPRFAFWKFVTFIVRRNMELTKDQIQDVLVWEILRTNSMKLEIVLSTGETKYLTFLKNNDRICKIIDWEEEICDIADFEILEDEGKLIKYLNKYCPFTVVELL